MALTVEDGTSVSGANSYISLADANTYMSTRTNGTHAWDSASDDDKEQALIEAMDFMENQYRDKMRGVQEYEGQLWAWPREYVYDLRGDEYTGIPSRLKYAQVEFAAFYLTEGTLYLNPSTDDTGQQVKRTREEVGPLKTETEFVSGGTIATAYSVPKAEQYIKDFIFDTDTLLRA